MHFVLCWFFTGVGVVLLHVFYVETRCKWCTTLFFCFFLLTETVSQSFKIVWIMKVNQAHEVFMC